MGFKIGFICPVKGAIQCIRCQISQDYIHKNEIQSPIIFMSTCVLQSRAHNVIQSTKGLLSICSNSMTYYYYVIIITHPISLSISVGAKLSVSLIKVYPWCSILLEAYIS